MRIAIALLAACVAVFAGDDAEKKAREALDAFAKAYKSRDEGERAAAVTALADFPSPGAIHALAEVLLVDTPTVRIAAAQTLGKYSGRKDVVPALGAAIDPNKADAKVTVALLKALGSTADPAAVDPLWALLKREVPKRDKADLDAEKTAIAALAQLHRKGCVEALVSLVHQNAVATPPTGKGQGTERAEAARLDKELRAALKALTGQALADWRAWEDWWKANVDKLDDQINPK